MFLTVGMLAHVDAGKTTFCEQLLYRTGVIRNIGRVDHASAFMDSHPLERKRGITIFNSQASLQIGEHILQIVDTPGHADFGAEMERAVSILDCAVLLLSCVEGIQPHTRTVWQILEQYHIPVCFFLNKTDRSGAKPDELIDELKKTFSGSVADMRDPQQVTELAAEADDRTLEKYLSGTLTQEETDEAFMRSFFARGVFPAFTGSALLGEGIDAVLHFLTEAAEKKPKPDKDAAFSAQVYAVYTDERHGRVACMKVLQGSIAPRAAIPETEQRITGLYRMQGEKLQPIESASAGMLCAAAGLSVRAGDRIGINAGRNAEILVPMLEADVEYPSDISPQRILTILHSLEDEDPELAVEWHEQTRTAMVHIMGTVQMETLQEIIRSKYGIEVRFGHCHVQYLETIAEPSMGVGHYEPLRHYAEVRVLLEPAPRGSGITFESRCHVDFLSAHWQHLIQSILLKKKHRGVLTGAPLTDVHIVLLNGRAHLKHTEGGDFYEAACRAVRQGLMKAKSLLLEPQCRFRIRVPQKYADSLLKEFIRIDALLEEMVSDGDISILNGTAPASGFILLVEKLPALTHGQGSTDWEITGYDICKNADSVVSDLAYNPLADQENSPNSVFCQKGAGFTVLWDHADEWAHTDCEASY